RRRQGGAYDVRRAEERGAAGRLGRVRLYHQAAAREPRARPLRPAADGEIAARPQRAGLARRGVQDPVTEQAPWVHRRPAGPPPPSGGETGRASPARAAESVSSSGMDPRTGSALAYLAGP